VERSKVRLLPVNTKVSLPLPQKSVDNVTYNVYSHKDAPTAKLWVEQGLSFLTTLNMSATVFVKDGNTIILKITFSDKVHGLTTGFEDRQTFKIDGIAVKAAWSGTDDTNIRMLSYTICWSILMRINIICDIINRFYYT
jgi:hypothetical protein